MTRRLSRRGFLGALGGVAVAGVGGVTASVVACGMRSDGAEQAALRLSVALPDILHPERLARWYMTAALDPALASNLHKASGIAALSAIDCDATRRAAIAERVQQDFARGDVLVADRIVVARTECLIAAVCLHRQLNADLTAPFGSGVWRTPPVRTS